MSGVSKRVKGKGKELSKRQKANPSSSMSQIYLTRKECEDTGQPLPPSNYGLDLSFITSSLSFTGDDLMRYNSILSLKLLPFR